MATLSVDSIQGIISLPNVNAQLLVGQTSNATCDKRWVGRAEGDIVYCSWDELEWYWDLMTFGLHPASKLSQCKAYILIGSCANY